MVTLPRPSNSSRRPHELSKGSHKTEPMAIHVLEVAQEQVAGDPVRWLACCEGDGEDTFEENTLEQAWEAAVAWVKDIAWREEVGMEHLVVLDEETHEGLNPEVAASWKGYRYKMSFDVVTHASAADGDIASNGWEEEGSDAFPTLEELLRQSDIRFKSWLEWSSSKPEAGSWVISQAAEDMRTGDSTTYHLFVERVDGQPINREEIDFITSTLQLL